MKKRLGSRVLDLNKELRAAVRHFWRVRQSQSERQGRATGIKDTGTRAAVTGGKHSDGFVALLAAVLREAGIADAQIFARDRILPGYFRPSKDWDLIVKVGDDLIAVVEVKSHVGSFGNNFNNRVEEALGNAADFWAAYSEATFAPSARPWLGYLIMLEEHPKATRPAKRKNLRHYPMREEFQGASYARRYEIFCQRLVRERVYDAACLIMSSAQGGPKGEYSEPNREVGSKNFAASLSARASAFASLR
jgi:Restriction endonuclease XhoI